MDAYQQTLQKLYQTPLEKFVAARKRLADERRAAGDPEAARRLAKLRRPTTAAWTVNQLYQRARDAFDDMLEAAARLRRGETDAVREYREAVGKLRDGAVAILKGAGRGMPDATLRRVTSTLGAIAAAGGFDPDPPGALVTDRDPPGFDAFDPSARSGAKRGPDRPPDLPVHRREARSGGRDELSAARARAAERAKREQAEQRAAERIEKRRQDAERARRVSERRKVERRLRRARAQAHERTRMLAVRQKELRAAEEASGDARTIVENLERKLRELHDAT
jgi:hypothetical protein